MNSFKRFVYKLNNIFYRGTPCTDAINANGRSGVYSLDLNVGTGIGYSGIVYEAFGVPDRFQIYWNNNLVADSKYVGDDITSSNPTGGVASGNYVVPNFEYTNGAFVDTGTTTNLVVNNSIDVANNTTEPTNGSGTLLFYKDLEEEITIRVVITSKPVGSTQWGLSGICPTEEPPKGNQKFVYGFFDEANKTATTRSFGIYLGGDAKFYTNRILGENFQPLGWTSTTNYFNDGINWWQIDSTGVILSTGLV